MDSFFVYVWNSKVEKAMPCLNGINLKQLPEDIRIDARKKINNNLSEAIKRSRHAACLICGKEGGFCNSHSIPQFCLKYIAEEGEVRSIFALVDMDISEQQPGVKKAGTSHIICRDCDSRAFQSYENPDAYSDAPGEELLNQIAMKTALRDIYKHEAEVALGEITFRTMCDKCPEFTDMLKQRREAQIFTQNADISECYRIFDQAKSYAENKESWLELISYDLLDYIVPVAYQGMIAMITGVNGEIINDRFNMDTSYEMQYLHLAVFPLNGKSVVLTFKKKNDIRLNEFSSYLRAIKQSKRLNILNTILFLYAEDYFFCKGLPEETCEKLRATAQTIETPEAISMLAEMSVRQEVTEYNLKRKRDIPNVLLPGYAVRLD